ncbi:Thioesterase/thiol ester dehydrase-isomerase [Peniophora sp. CONT]|nr:Thioesterase/thiol ester dehydrase-isomerase [Peniophora sp. CONT]
MGESSNNAKSGEAATLKSRSRTEYPFFLTYRTRWSDNDQYGHVNNSVYYHLFDSVINAYLIAHCGLEPTKSERIGLVVESHASFFAPLAFPEVLELGLRAIALGRSSVTYEVGVWKEGVEKVAAVGGYTHVFVDSESRRTSAIEGNLRVGLGRLLVDGAGSKSKL